MGNEIETPADVLQRLGDDAAKWAAEFRATAVRLGYSDMDEGWLIGWFANAIEHSGAVRRWRKDAATLRQQAFSQFANPEALADWLDALHECHADGSVGNRKWEAAQVAARAIRSLNEPSGNSGQLRQQAGRVDEGMVERMIEEYMRLAPNEVEWAGVSVDCPETRDFCRSLLTAALAQPTQAGEAVEFSMLAGSCKITGPKADVLHIAKIIGEPDDFHAERARVPDGWSGWCTQYPDRLPKLWGARAIAELNYYPEEGQRMFQVVEVATATSQRSEVK